MAEEATALFETTMPLAIPVTVEEEPRISRIGNYKLSWQLSSGAARSKVVLGVHTETGKRVAIKILNKEPSSDGEREGEDPELGVHDSDSSDDSTSHDTHRTCSGQKHKEFKIMSQLHHPHIVNLLEVVESKHRVCIVMEYAEGGDLLSYIPPGGLSTYEAWRLFRQILSAIDYLHNQHFVHRDIKPENIFLDAQHNVLLGDFGLAARWHESKYKSRCCGSFGYMPPCLLQNMPAYIGPEVDVWSTGVCLYRMLYNKFPFRSTSNFETIQKIKHGQWRDESIAMMPELVDLFNRMFCPDRTKRATIQEVLSHPWVTHPPREDSSSWSRGSSSATTSSKRLVRSTSEKGKRRKKRPKRKGLAIIYEE